MATPSSKSPAIEKFLTSLAPGKLTRVEAIRQGKCVWCGGPANAFKDEVNMREYNLTGYCQKCQDMTFKK
jgi:hypothetical protein